MYKIPLEDSGGAGTVSGHWEDNYRNSSYLGGDLYTYPGVSNELMVGTISPGQPRILSKLSIGGLLDFGYVEITPGNNEGTPTLRNSLSAQNISLADKIHLNCQLSMPKENVGTIVVPALNNSAVGKLSTPVLFNKSSWASVVSEPYKTYLDQSADRWATYMNYDPAIFTAIRALPGWSAWNGMALEPTKYSLYTNSGISTIASCGPWNYVDLQPSGPGVRFNSLTFQLNINDYYRTLFSGSDWVNIITHELGHALGIGIYWHPSLASAGAVPPVNNFLDGNSYVNCKNAYLDIIAAP
jgi:hypothetical protein